eukprot:744418-Rhodomonas_salina.1
MVEHVYLYEAIGGCEELRRPERALICTTCKLSKEPRLEPGRRCTASAGPRSDLKWGRSEVPPRAGRRRLQAARLEIESIVF